MADRFVGRRVFITGAGSGVGRATARRFAAEGAHVFAVDVNAAGLRETVDAIRAAGGTAHGAPCDVADMASVDGAVAQAVAALGGLDILLNVAGVGRFARFEEITAEQWQRTLAINMGGAFHTMKAAIPHLLKGTRPNVVNVGSTASLRGTAYAADYGASKAGLVMLSRCLALEFATRGLRVNCVCPGGVRTPLGRFFMLRDDFEMHLIDYARAPNPTSFAEPEDIANIIAFVASDEAHMMNGAIVTADAGTLA